ncbi:lipoprotein-anchoring transpeptidase ErfK/SrfK [Pseudorhizobium tarimense]|uniref:Lipoprotein-anchoring transpeptidase ErfK/SrfK n=1 Tax=Pseudorhizobium tarimense TaxID=1079109 RepID=A0ABV2H0M3_9HYPH|nr:L,D-transpeptidase [Pseudorhizobium tarimense]MCJ8517419.1 L,D-transpeptidase [Pseudorhizobium tarimense]
MSSLPHTLRRSLSLLAAGTAAASLSGCILVTDTSRMNPDVFVQETAPVFYVPPYVDPPTNQPPPMPGGIPHRRQLYPTYFHQTYRPTYGLPVTNPVHRVMYGVINDGGHTLPAIPYLRIDPRFLRQEVAYQTTEAPGTIVVDTREQYLYLVQSGGKAIRYGVGLGKEGFAWSGRGVIQWKAKWPRWTPPSDMVARQPELRQFAAAEGGANPGLNNPLGARALYIFKDGKDTLYRVHGTPDWQSVGKATSSGCVRMLNQDVIDLYDRVPDSTPIVVL